MGFSGGEWVCTLKVHGSNYAFYYDGNEILRAKRTSFLGTDKFMGDHHINYDEQIKALYDDLKKHVDFSVLSIHGEIYGGMYNHPNVPKKSGYTRIQKEVQYCPENRFICYDIALDGCFTNWNTVFKKCKQFDIPVVPELKRGTFEELIDYPVDFPDPLHKRFGLPPIEGNSAEGWVLKPVQNKLFPDGSRVILKGKGEKFKEQNRVKKAPKIVELSDAGNEIRDIFLSFITESRLKNVCSHGHDIGQKDFGKLMGLLIQDALSDFKKDYGEKFECLDLDEQKIIKRQVQREAGDIIRPNFINIIDGRF